MNVRKFTGFLVALFALLLFDTAQAVVFLQKKDGEPRHETDRRVSALVYALSGIDLQAIQRSPNESLPHDVVVVLTDSAGTPIVNHTKGGKKKFSGNDLTITYNSLDPYPWSAQDLLALQQCVADTYPLIKQKYGPPAVSGTVNVSYNPTIPFAGLYYFGTNESEIVLQSTDCSVLAHETTHAFHGPFIMGPDAYEEGMARAVEVVVMSALPQYPYFDANHSYGIDVFYDIQNNQPGMASLGGEFFLGFPNALLKYQQAGYAWGKLLLEDSKFFLNFNQTYYQLATGNPSLVYDAEGVKSIACKVKPTVEGQACADWFAAQQIFNFNPPAGIQTVFKGDTNTLYAYERDASGYEYPFAGVQVDWEVVSCEGDVLLSGTDVTTGLGWIDFPLYQTPYQGKVNLSAHVYLSDGAVIDWPIETVTGLPQQGIFGVVPQGCSGKVWLGGKRGKTTTIPVVNGAFAIPNLSNAGTYSIGLVGGRATKTFTKDAAPYFVTAPQ